MARWPNLGAIERIRSLFCCPDIDTEVRWEFCYYLWDEHRDAVVSLALSAAQQARDLELAARVARWAHEEPRATDRELLWWAAWQDTEWQLPYWALQGLERLGEDSQPWRQRLDTLSRSESPFVRLQAAGALVRRGNGSRLTEIVRDATEAEDACIRGEAIRVLGELGSEEYLPLFERALWADEPVFVCYLDPYEEDPEWRERSRTSYLPVGEEAALALARLGTPGAMTTLIHAFLLLPPREVRLQIEFHLDTLMARMDGDNQTFDSMPWMGWRQECFGRLP
jgi:HEAT repeat protein